MGRKPKRAMACKAAISFTGDDWLRIMMAVDKWVDEATSDQKYHLQGITRRIRKKLPWKILHAIAKGNE